MLTISEEQVKALNSEFTSLMKSIYSNLAKKYEDIVKNIVTDADLDHIDFPLIALDFNVEKLSGLLPPELVEKLGGLEDDDEPYSPEEQAIKKDEEYKEGELEDMKKAAEVNNPQDLHQTYKSTEEAAVNDQQSSQKIADDVANMNLNDNE